MTIRITKPMASQEQTDRALKAIMRMNPGEMPFLLAFLLGMFGTPEFCKEIEDWNRTWPEEEKPCSLN